MPVCVKPWDHKSREIRVQEFISDIKSLNPDANIFGASLGDHGQGDSRTGTISTQWRRSTNGLLDAITTAYSGHHHLIIRPEDVWFQILTQFSVYVNRNSKKLGRHFVAHNATKKLVVDYEADSTRWTFDYGQFARDIAEMIEGNVTDSELRDWIVPDFSTTTENDREAASLIMMAALRKYFMYECRTMCGIPSVTLLGERADYEKLFAKLNKLEKYGKEPARFATVLRPVVRAFASTFDDPSAEEVVEFWRKICDIKSGSGFTRYTGWITAFCFWNDEGVLLHKFTKADDRSRRIGDVEHRTGHSKKRSCVGRCIDWVAAVCSRSAERDLRLEKDLCPTLAEFDGKPHVDAGSDGGDSCFGPELWLFVDGVKYHEVSKLPIGISMVPVIINDQKGPKVNATMAVGSVGIACSSSGESMEKITWDKADYRKEHKEIVPPGLDVMQPVTGWWISERIQLPKIHPRAHRLILLG